MNETIDSGTQVGDTLTLISDASDGLLQLFDATGDEERNTLIKTFKKFCERLSSLTQLDLNRNSPSHILNNLRLIIDSHFPGSHPKRKDVLDSYHKALHSVRLQLAGNLLHKELSWSERSQRKQELIEYLTYFSYPEEIDGVICIALVYSGFAMLYDTEIINDFKPHVNNLLQAYYYILQHLNNHTLADLDKLKNVADIINSYINEAVETLVTTNLELADALLNQMHAPQDALTLVKSIDAGYQLYAEHYSEQSKAYSLQIKNCLLDCYLKNFDTAYASQDFETALTMALHYKELLEQCTQINGFQPHLITTNDIRIARCYNALKKFNLAIKIITPLVLTNQDSSTAPQTHALIPIARNLLDTSLSQIIEKLTQRAELCTCNNPQQALDHYHSALSIIEQAATEFELDYISDKIRIYIEMFNAVGRLEPSKKSDATSNSLITEACDFFCSSLEPIDHESKIGATLLLDFIDHHIRKSDHETSQQLLYKLNIQLHIALSKIGVININHDKARFWKLHNTFSAIKNPSQRLTAGYRELLTKSRTICLVNNSLFKKQGGDCRLSSSQHNRFTV